MTSEATLNLYLKAEDEDDACFQHELDWAWFHD